MVGRSVKVDETSLVEVESARKLLGLGEEASIRDVESAFRRLALEYHPDRCGGSASCEEMMRRLNRARRLLLEYCSSCRISFRKNDVETVSRGYADEHFRRFFEEWWG